MALSYTQNLEDYHFRSPSRARPAGSMSTLGAATPSPTMSATGSTSGLGGRGSGAPGRTSSALHQRLRPRDTYFVASSAGRAAHRRALVDRFHGLSTTVEAFAQKARELGTDYRTEALPSLTLADLCERHGLHEIDFLKIDVEGAEADVLAGGDFSHFRPKVIVAEADRAGDGRAGVAGLGAAVAGSGLRVRAVRHPEPLLRGEGADGDRWRACRGSGPLGTPRRTCTRSAAPRRTLPIPSTKFHAPWREDCGRASRCWSRRWSPGSCCSGGYGARARPAAVAALAATLGTDEGRARLGRIACGYDGGQIVEGERW